MARRKGHGDDKNSFSAESVNGFLRDLHTGWFTRPKDIG